MVKTVERYKKFVSTTAIILMGLSMLFTLGIFGYNFFSLTSEKFFLTRVRQQITKVVDFETITTSQVGYFLYRNTSYYAVDAGSDRAFWIVDEELADRVCEGKGYFSDLDADRVENIRDNITSPYIMISTIYLLILMLAAFILAVIVFPQKIREHHIPVLLRQADENMFHVVMRVRNGTLLYFIVLAGCLCQLTNYFVEDRCLHTH